VSEIFRGNDDGVGVEMICRICGKHFFPTNQWAYRHRNGDLVCSYTCSKAKGKVAVKVRPNYTVIIPTKAIGSREKLYRALHERGFTTLVEFTEQCIKELYESVKHLET